MSATQGERLGIVERGLHDHEINCEKRLRDIKDIAQRTDDKIDKLASGTTAKIDKLHSFVVGLIVAVCGGSLIILAQIALHLGAS